MRSDFRIAYRAEAASPFVLPPRTYSILLWSFRMTSRRTFLTQIGQVGGFSATYVMMQSLGLLAIPAAKASTIALAENSGKGKTVVILGAGIAGLVAAWELKKAGYACTILEARNRAGGRNWTIRNGTRVEMTDGTAETCQFAEGHYFNAGPARLPSAHHTILGYCREFGVPLEVEVNSSRSALLQCDSLNGGKPVEQRQVMNDTRGHVAELLAKSVNKQALDEELTKEDQERMLAFLRKYGDLSPDNVYKGSQRSGFKSSPGAADQLGVPRDPLDMHALLNASLWEAMLFEEMYDMQATMFQPVGGMDQIATAFETRLAGNIRFESCVEQIRKTSRGVRIGYRDRKTGSAGSIEADCCICAMPLSILKTIDADFSPDFKNAIEGAKYDSAYKIAWESRRFWEQDYSIYGGISFPKQTVGVVWYPSAKLFSEKGVVVAGYGIENDTPIGKLNYQEKLAASRAAIEHLHPGCSKELTKPVYVSWGHIPYNLGSWIAHFGQKDMGLPGYARLTEPDGAIYIAGDHVTHLVGWQEGAALSAHRAVAKIDQAIGGRPAQVAYSRAESA
jgi:monoamine oxidase